MQVTQLWVMAPAMTRIIVLSEAGSGITENSLWYATSAPMSFQWIQSTDIAAEPSCMKFVLSADTDILRSTRYATSVALIKKSTLKNRGK